MSPFHRASRGCGHCSRRGFDSGKRDPYRGLSDRERLTQGELVPR